MHTWDYETIFVFVECKNACRVATGNETFRQSLAVYLLWLFYMNTMHPMWGAMKAFMTINYFCLRVSLSLADERENCNWRKVEYFDPNLLLRSQSWCKHSSKPYIKVNEKTCRYVDDHQSHLVNSSSDTFFCLLNREAPPGETGIVPRFQRNVLNTIFSPVSWLPLHIATTVVYLSSLQSCMC